MTGTVARVLADKKFGFIRGEDGKDYFFHFTDLTGFWEDLVADSQVHTVTVTFEPTVGKKGLRAAEVNRVDGGLG
jgi:cold shock CspA family protein